MMAWKQKHGINGRHHLNRTYMFGLTENFVQLERLVRVGNAIGPRLLVGLTFLIRHARIDSDTDDRPDT